MTGPFPLTTRGIRPVPCHACGRAFWLEVGENDTPLAFHKTPTCPAFDAIVTSDDAVGFSQLSRKKAQAPRMTWPEDDDSAPYVCPGCYAVGGEPCAPGCVDAAIEERHREAVESGNYERFDDGHDDGDDDDWSAPGPDDGGDEVLTALALMEAERPYFLPGGVVFAHPFDPGARSCVWCHELIADDLYHDFCEPDEPTEVLPRGPQERPH